MRDFWLGFVLFIPWQEMYVVCEGLGEFNGYFGQVTMVKNKTLCDCEPQSQNPFFFAFARNRYYI